MKMRWLFALVLPVLTACNLFTGMFSVVESVTESEPIIEVPTVYENIPQSATEEGFPVLGDPDAPIEIMVFSSFSCPSCADFHQNIFLQLLPYFADGTAKYITVPMQTGSVPNISMANVVALCAGVQGKFYEYAHMLYDYHIEYRNDAFIPDHFRDIVSALSLDEDVWQTCLSYVETDEIIINAVNLYAELNVPGTPTVFVNGQQVNSNTLEAIEEAINNG